MKKSKKTYLLLGLVLMIWGILGYKVIGAINPSDDPILVMEQQEVFVPTTIKKKDTFSITADYRDPFLGTMPKIDRPKNTKAKTLQKPELPKKNIVYSGSVARNGTTDRMFFVTIEGQQHIMSQSETVQGVKLVRGSSESIRVRYNGHTETVMLQQ